MRFLGIDYGAKRVGVAISDEEGKFAFPHSILPNDKNLITALIKIAKEKKAAVIVVGDSRTVSGSTNPITHEVEEWMRVLEAHSGLGVVSSWEAWSSVEARRFSGEERAHDASAAAIILQRYLDTKSKAD